MSLPGPGTPRWPACEMVNTHIPGLKNNKNEKVEGISYGS